MRRGRSSLVLLARVGLAAALALGVAPIATAVAAPVTADLLAAQPATGGAAHLRWTPPPGAATTSIKIDRAAGSTWTTFRTDTCRGCRELRVKGLQRGTRYRFTPTIRDAASRRLLSPGPTELLVPATDAAPASAQGLVLEQLPGDTMLRARWSAPTTGFAVDDYLVEAFVPNTTGGWRRATAANFVEPYDGTSAFIPTALEGARWYVVVHARNSIGWAPPAVTAPLLVADRCAPARLCATIGGAASSPTVGLYGQGVSSGTGSGTGQHVSPALMLPLKVRNWRLAGKVDALDARAAGARSTTQVLSSIWWQITAPGNGGYALAPWRDLPAFEATVESLARTAKAEGWAPTYWDVWNEPDNLCCPQLSPADRASVTAEQIFSIFESAHRAIKRGDPSAKVVGPSVATLTMGPGDPSILLDLGTFVRWSAQKGLMWDAVAWHDNYTTMHPTGDLGAMTGNIERKAAAVRQLLAENPTVVPSRTILVTEYGHSREHMVAGWAVGYLRLFEDLQVEANRSCWTVGCSGTSPSDLFGPDGATPTAAYHVARLAGDMDAKPRVGVTTTSSGQLEGLAVREDATKTIRALLGRHVWCTKVGNPYCDIEFYVLPEPTSVTVAWPYGGTTVRVKVSRMPVGIGRLDVPVLVLDRVVSLIQGKAIVDVGLMADGDALSIVVTQV